MNFSFIGKPKPQVEPKSCPIIKNTPKIGEIYIINNCALDPWGINNKYTVTIIDVKNGWVKYRPFYNLPAHSDECETVIKFQSMYKLT
jgi:hypothetical protein